MNGVPIEFVNVNGVERFATFSVSPVCDTAEIESIDESIGVVPSLRDVQETTEIAAIDCVSFGTVTEIFSEILKPPAFGGSAANVNSEVLILNASTRFLAREDVSLFKVPIISEEFVVFDTEIFAS